jgi:hypothetical protein
LNEDNRPDPSARALYYGLAQVPHIIMDGSYKDEEFSQWAEIDFQERILDDAPFTLDVSFEDRIERLLNVRVEVQALTAIEAEVTLHIAVVEREIETVITGLGERKYFNVLKKMLPSAGGTRLEKTTWTTGEIKEVSQSWSPKNVFDPEQLAVVVFLQNNTTKEIYQATFAQPADPPLITGLDEQPEIQDEDNFIIYPNPASDQVRVLLETSNLYHWKIYDKFGRVAMAGKTDHTRTFTLDVQTLASGLYILQLENKDKRNYSARFSVIR